MTTNNNVTEITINYKHKVRPSELPKITSSQDAVNYLRQIWSDKIEYVEEMYLLLLNRANKVLGYTKLSQGGTTSTVVDAKLVFQAALKANACAIILAHNHPSGNLLPSMEDKAITKRIKEIGKQLDLTLFDHIILTADGEFSFADEGIFVR